MAYVNVSRDPERNIKNGYLATSLVCMGTTLVTFAKQVFGLEESATVQWP